MHCAYADSSAEVSYCLIWEAKTSGSRIDAIADEVADLGNRTPIHRLQNFVHEFWHRIGERCSTP